MPLYNLATRRLEDTYPYVTQVSKSSVNPDKWSFADGLGNPVYWFDGTASYAASGAGTAATSSYSLTTKAAGIEWDIQLNSASAINGVLGVAELGRGYYNWNYGAWTFGNRITGSAANLIGSWSFHTNKDNYAIGDYSIAHGYKNIAVDSADSVEGYFTSTVNDTVTSLNLNFTYDAISAKLVVLQPGDFTTQLNSLDLTNTILNAWYYNATDDILYPAILPAVATYNAGTNRTEILTPANLGNTDLTGNGVLYYQSFSSIIKGEPLANHAEGDHTIASGDASHAEGKYTWASAVGSHAEGLNTISSNSGSHAEGRNTQAKGDGSHAEGSDTIASGSSAHAEGYATLAQGEFSHAEGFYTIASGSAAHAGGRETNALGYGSRAIGYQTNAIGQYSHAEGRIVKSSGDYSHAEGYNTTASANYSHAEGYTTYAYGSGSHTEGDRTIAYGNQSHAEGQATQAGTKGFLSLDAGYSNYPFIYLESFYGNITSSFQFSTYVVVADPTNTFNKVIGYQYVSVYYDSILGQTVIELDPSTFLFPPPVSNVPVVITPIGYDPPTANSIIYADWAHAEGLNTKAIGIGSHAEGQLTLSIGQGSHAEGGDTQAIGNASHAEGSTTYAIGSNSHAEGSNTQAKGDASHAEGNYTISQGLYSHAEGSASYAGGEGSHAEGIGTYIYDQTDYAHAEGAFTYVRGDYSHAEGFYTSASYAVKAPVAAHAEGYRTKALNIGAHAEGYYTAASGAYSHAEGHSTLTTVFAVAGHAEGSGSIAHGSASHAEGIFTVASGSGQLAVGRYNLLNNTSDYFVIGDGTSAARSNALGVNDIRFYASNSIYFPDLSLASPTLANVVSFDTTTGRIYYQPAGSGTPSNISFYSGSILLTASFNSLVITGSGITATNNNGQVTMSFSAGGGGAGTVGPGSVPYLAYFNNTNTITSNTIRYNTSENRYAVEGNSVDVANNQYNSSTALPPNIVEPLSVALPNDDGSNVYTNNIINSSEQQVIFSAKQDYVSTGGLGPYNRGPYLVNLKKIDLGISSGVGGAIITYGVKIDYSLLILESSLFGTTSFNDTAVAVGQYQPISPYWAAPAYTETGTILATFSGQDIATIYGTSPTYVTLNAPMTSQLALYNWVTALPNRGINISENWTYTIDPTWTWYGVTGALPHDNNRGFQFAYRVVNNAINDCYFEWVVSQDFDSVSSTTGLGDIYISYVTTILRHKVLT